MTEQAIEKLVAEEKAGTFDCWAQVMKKNVREALEDFCRQDEEFAAAIVQGGTFEDCMKAVAKNCGNGLSDLEAYRRAVQFYFQGADIRFHMTIDLCASVREEEEELNGAPRRNPAKRLRWGEDERRPRRSPAKRVRWGKDEQRRERVFAKGGNEGFAACEDAYDAIRKAAGA